VEVAEQILAAEGWMVMAKMHKRKKAAEGQMVEAKVREAAARSPGQPDPVHFVSDAELSLDACVACVACVAWLDCWLDKWGEASARTWSVHSWKPGFDMPRIELEHQAP